MVEPATIHPEDGHEAACEKSPAASALVSGLLFRPRYTFTQGQPLDPGIIKPQRTAEEVRTMLGAHREVELTITGHLRGVDGAGSSLDLPEFQKALTRPGAKKLSDLPSTPTIASEFTTTIRFELGSDPEVIEYVAPDYGITAQKPHRIRGKVSLDRYGKTSQLNGPAFVFRNIFGLSGIRITCEAISPMALAGGMESSNVFNVALLAAASMLSGAGLSLADIFSLAVKLENDEFGGLTGGQGHLCCMVGCAYRHVWLSGLKDAAGRMGNPYSAFSIKLFSDSALDSLADHLALVQAGKSYEDGRPLIFRRASFINAMWTDLLRDRDRIGLPLLYEKLELAERFARALQKGDFETTVAAINRYVEIRDALCRRWINLALDAREGRTDSDDGSELPPYAAEYALVFDESNTRYNDSGTIRDFYRRDKDRLRKTSFYTLSPIAELVGKAKDAGIAVMPLGAGGPGANLIAISSEGRKHLEGFLESQDLHRLTEDKARAIIRGTGTLKGYIPFHAGKEPLTINGFGQLGLKLPEAPENCLYNQETGQFERPGAGVIIGKPAPPP